MKKVKKLHHWPDVPVAQWREIYRLEHGVELKTGDLAYKKISTALKNARYKLGVRGVSVAVGRQMAEQAGCWPCETYERAAAASKLRYRELLEKHE